MKKSKRNPRSLLKLLLAATLFGFYWYFVNQRIISDSNQAFGLGGFFLLMCTATAYFPIPANLLVLGAVKTATPMVVALVAGVATLVAYLSEHIFFTLLFKFNRIANFRNSWIYQKVRPLFDRQKFAMLTFASFLPIPSEPLRLYAITSNYPRFSYMLAGLIGRVPRYYLLGYYGKDYVNSPLFLAAVFLFPAVFLLALRGTVSLVGWSKRTFGGPAESAVPLTVTASPPTPGAETEPGAS